MAFELKTLPDGSSNPKYVDLCGEDPPIAGQKYCCISFISPEKLLKKREIFMFDQFVKQWGFSKSMSEIFGFLNFVAYKYNMNIEALVDDFNEYVKEEDVILKTKFSVEDDWKTYVEKNEETLLEKFSREHAFQTSVRGIKVRGNFPTQEEAEMFGKKLRNNDPAHDVCVGMVGVWMPWDPDAYKTGRVEFLEPEMNQLHKEKLMNEEKARQDFEARMKETKKKAIQENIEKAKKSGNVLTQTMDEQGNLVGVMQNVNFEEREAAAADISKELARAALSANTKTVDSSSV